MHKNSKIIELPVRNDNNADKSIKKAAHKKKRKLNLINLVFVVFMLYFFMTVTSQKQMIRNLDEQIAQKETQRDSVKKKAESLASDVASIDDQQVLLEVVERVARNEYKMVKPNEIIYIDKNKMNNKFIMGIGYEQDNINIKDSSENSGNNE
ncbi:MAG TPA: hypothetical protein DC000_02965 [Clostridiales bacterium]|nr:hypothetical protein [Clostridiales bacterium]